MDMTKAEEFEAEMKEIWNDDPNDLYDEWCNANERARFRGAVQTGNESDTGFDLIWVEWEFGDESKVWIGKAGNQTEGNLE
jgi:hypothetical protein